MGGNPHKEEPPHRKRAVIRSRPFFKNKNREHCGRPRFFLFISGYVKQHPVGKALLCRLATTSNRRWETNGSIFEFGISSFVPYDRPCKDPITGCQVKNHADPAILFITASSAMEYPYVPKPTNFAVTMSEIRERCRNCSL